jgi:glycosyltransferase involved in cell wall biosynthesis
MHFSATIRAILDRGNEVVIVVEQEMLGARLRMGWKVPDFGKAIIIVNSKRQETDATIRRYRPEEAIHILSGMRENYYRHIIHRLIDSKCRFGFYGEAPHPDGILVYPKRLVYTVLSTSLISHGCFFIALGRSSAEWFRDCGWHSKNVFECAYAVEQPPDKCPNKKIENRENSFEIIFVGRFLPIKRIDLAFKALSMQSNQNWHFTLIGNGPVKEEIVALAHSLNISHRVSFYDFMPNSKAIQHIADSDLLILPSVHEGWGAVVNEALMSGVRAICSDQCGVADLLRDSERGKIFHSCDVHSLAQALGKEIALGKQTEKNRAALRAWSECISGSSIADYMLAILDHIYDGGVRPNPPWLGSKHKES